VIQGDQIGQIFVSWAIVYFESGLKNVYVEIAQIIMIYFLANSSGHPERWQD
jgi:hypothetical protein